MTRRITLVDIGNPLAIYGVLPNVLLGDAYSAQLTARGGRAPYTYTVVAGALPTGMQLDATTGLVSGTPSAGGPFPFTVKATDNTGRSVKRSYVITVVAAPLMLAISGTFAAATVGVPYSSDLTITNGTVPYTLHGGTGVTVGTLPSWATLSIVGDKLRLSGTPTGVSTTVNITVAVDSGDGQTATSAQILSVTAGWATWSAADKGTNISLSADKMTATSSGPVRVTANYTVLSSVGLPNKVYYEVEVTSDATNAEGVAGGVSFYGHSLDYGYLGDSTDSAGIYATDKSVWFNGVKIATAAGTVSGKTIRVQVALDDLKVWLRVSPTSGWVGGGNPVTGSSPTATMSGVGLIYAAASMDGVTTATLISDPSLMTGAPPSGFAVGIPG